MRGRRVPKPQPEAHRPALSTKSVTFVTAQRDIDCRLESLKEFYFGKRDPGMVLCGTQSRSTFNTLLTRLRPSHAVVLYEGIKGLRQTREGAPGVDGHDLVRMVHRGVTFAKSSEVLESKIENSRSV
jgi:hypothetical protein